MKNATKVDQAHQYPVAQIVKRAAVIAAVIGTTLTLISQPDAVFDNAKLERLPMAMVFITPFLVVSISQVFGIREGRRAVSQGAHRNKEFVEIMFSHGIPLRAAALGLAACAVNTGLVSIALMTAGQSLAQLPVNLIAQALFLPMIFGTLSQTLSFRRTIRFSA
jgi:hypothetical protein